MYQVLGKVIPAEQYVLWILDSLRDDCNRHLHHLNQA